MLLRASRDFVRPQQLLCGDVEDLEVWSAGILVHVGAGFHCDHSERIDQGSFYVAVEKFMKVIDIALLARMGHPSTSPFLETLAPVVF